MLKTWLTRRKKAWDRLGLLATANVFTIFTYNKSSLTYTSRHVKYRRKISVVDTK
jgi:hypothetical protein